MPESLLRLRQVRDACALSRSEIYRRLKVGDFPRPVALGRRSVAWRASDIENWIAGRITKHQSAQVDRSAAQAHDANQAA